MYVVHALSTLYSWLKEVCKLYAVMGFQIDFSALSIITHAALSLELMVLPLVSGHAGGMKYGYKDPLNRKRYSLYWYVYKRKHSMKHVVSTLRRTRATGNRAVETGILPSRRWRKWMRSDAPRRSFVKISSQHLSNVFSNSGPLNPLFICSCRLHFHFSTSGPPRQYTSFVTLVFKS